MHCIQCCRGVNAFVGAVGKEVQWLTECPAIRRFEFSGKSYKVSMIVNYNSRVLNIRNLLVIMIPES